MSVRRHPLPVVEPGQVWADNDRRSNGRTVRVDRVVNDPTKGEQVAVCTVLTNSDRVQSFIGSGSNHFRDTRGTTVRIAVRRMRPTSTGYRLVPAEAGA